MNTDKLLEKFSLTDNPVALGGCQTDGNSFDCCEYNITIFDDKKDEKDSIINFEDETIRIHHGSMREKKPNLLTQFSNMKILSDEKWELRIFLSKISERKTKIFKTFAKSCIIDAAVCVTKTNECLKNSEPFSSSWIKCAAYYIADAIVLSNNLRPSPTHMLEQMRSFEKNKINEKFFQVNECIGVERATPSLLERMSKSTMGFSDMVEDNGHSRIIQKKHLHLVKNSLIPDCYFYLGYINRNNFIKIKESLNRKPELIHVLKTAFDIENDMTKIQQQSTILEQTANDLLSILNS
jgi:hypothetical protein